MTRIDFYTGVASPRQFAARVIQTVFRKGEHLVAVLPDRPALQALSESLWTIGDTSFLAHSHWQAPEATECKIWLATGFDFPAGDHVLLNLSPDLPPIPSVFPRILEIVGQDHESTRIARQRYRHYLDLGFEIHHHDMSGVT